MTETETNIEEVCVGGEVFNLGQMPHLLTHFANVLGGKKAFSKV